MRFFKVAAILSILQSALIPTASADPIVDRLLACEDAKQNVLLWMRSAQATAKKGTGYECSAATAMEGAIGWADRVIESCPAAEKKAVLSARQMFVDALPAFRRSCRDPNWPMQR